MFLFLPVLDVYVLPPYIFIYCLRLHCNVKNFPNILPSLPFSLV